jgi:hypothetical protein
VLRSDPQNVAEAAHRTGRTDLSAWIAGEQLVAGISHMVIVGPLAGTALAALTATATRRASNAIPSQ